MSRIRATGQMTIQSVIDAFHAADREFDTRWPEERVDKLDDFANYDSDCFDLWSRQANYASALATLLTEARQEAANVLRYYYDAVESDMNHDSAEARAAAADDLALFVSGLFSISTTETEN